MSELPEVSSRFLLRCGAERRMPGGAAGRRRVWHLSGSSMLILIIQAPVPRKRGPEKDLLCAVFSSGPRLSGSWQRLGLRVYGQGGVSY